MDDPEGQACPECEDQGAEDPWCVSLAVVTPCPSPNKICDNPTHHYSRHDHVEELEA